MATVRRAYTSEYLYNTAPEVQPERVRRTRKRPEVNTDRNRRQAAQSGTLSPENLRILIFAVVAIGIMLIGIVVVNAQAAKLQYSINQLRSENGTLQTEISMMEIKAESSTGINQLETYAIEELGMHYPQGSECIYLSTVSAPEESLADIIRQKAYE